MSRPDEVSQLIAAAAKRALLPLGCQRVGRSRTWISDQRFWLIVIEFQPSSWEKGSYLNVGAMWLWRVAKGLSFNVGYRASGFVPFYNPEQFSSASSQLSESAKQEVEKLREQFGDLHKVYEYLVAHTSEKNWDIFHAAIAAGLVGDAATACRLFQAFADIPIRGTEWEIELCARHAGLAAQLNTPELFRDSVVKIIQECRSLNGLAPDLGCLGGPDIGGKVTA